MTDAEKVVGEAINAQSVDVLAVTKALVQIPDVGAKIREIQFENLMEVDANDDLLEELRDSIDPEIGSGILEKANDEVAARTGEERDWMLKIVLELWLFYAPNLEKLSITLDTCFDFQYFDGLRKKYKHLSFLSKLREIDARHWDTEGGMDFSVITPLLTAAPVHRVSVFSCTAFELDSDWTFPSVQQLVLDRAGLSLDDFNGMVKCFPKLEVLRYRLGDACCLEGLGGDYITAQKMSQSLIPLRDTLRELEIDQREHAETFGMELLEPIETLKEMQKLEVLKIWKYDLMADDDDEKPSALLEKLPESLKSISIFGMEADEGLREALAAADIEWMA